MKTQASFLGPRLSSCNIWRNSGWWVLWSGVVHTYNYEKMYIFKNKNCYKSAKLKILTFLKTRASFPRHRLSSCNIWRFWGWWFLRSGLIHTYNYEKMFIFKHEKWQKISQSEIFQSFITTVIIPKSFRSFVYAIEHIKFCNSHMLLE